ncbi:MAG: DUF1611 domain-containing protein [Anaerolineae bacterium]|jgi:uncharacterized NAD-dependent epimerase/dehydratase family protein|nr:DUF1611 domain-containing protein [Anaerolineae bacterium]MBT7324620.1 DUF1611 domain-containing protein [Anaerolineae bacterium]
MADIKKTALVYCDKQFDTVDGKTAAGLVRHSEIYAILGVIDSTLAGQDAGEVLGDKKNNIPIFTDLDEALESFAEMPSYYIYGKAPLEASIPAEERLLVLEAMKKGMHIINGLHQFFSEDQEFTQMAEECGVEIEDIRKPPPLEDLHVFTGQISKVNIPVIAVLGTDCATGKMTTAVELNNALNDMGIKSIMVATGQTSLMQGSKYGASIDALVAQFAIGEIENAVVQAFENEDPDIIFVEGQSAVSHPAFMSSVGILKGSMPDGVILQHPPAREFRVDFPQMAMPTVESEIQMIESISQSQVIAITINHEDLTDEEVSEAIIEHEDRLLLPTTDVLKYGCGTLIQVLADRFPALNEKIHQTNLDAIPIITMMSDEVIG